MKLKPSNNFIFSKHSRLLKFLVVLVAFAFMAIVYKVGGFIYCHTVAFCESARPPMSTRMLEEQYEFAIRDINEGRYESAKQRLEFVTFHDPHYLDATEKLLVIEKILDVLPSPTATAAFTLAAETKTPLPTATYFIPETTPRLRVLAAISRADVIGVSDKDIACLLFEKMLDQMKLKDVSDYLRITDYEITDFRYEDGGFVWACYVVTPASDEFSMINDKKLDDGRVRICYWFEVTKDGNSYYLDGYYSS